MLSTLSLLLLFFANPPQKRMKNGRVWTTENLNIQTATSFCYDGLAVKCTHYGRLYTWPEAMKICTTLGKRWRLPTDAEWREVAGGYGGIGDKSPETGIAAFKALTVGGPSGFNAVLGGGRNPDGTYARIEAHGFYWTATEDGPDSAIFYNFAKGRPGFFRQDGGEKVRAFAVRCIRD